MPDDDKLPRSLSARWWRVLKAFKAGESQEALEHHVAKAAAETLRRTRGVPELAALGAQMYMAAATGYYGHGDDGSSSRTLSAHIPTRLARQAIYALSGVMKERLALTSPDAAALLLARRVVADVVYTFGLDRMAPVLMSDGFDPVELRRRFEGIAQSNPLGELAKRLLAHPDGSGLRAPGRRRLKLATADLMDVNIEDVL